MLEFQKEKYSVRLTKHAYIRATENAIDSDTIEIAIQTGRM